MVGALSAERREIRESTSTTNLEQARRFLSLREGAIARGEAVRPKADRVTFAAMAEALRRDYRTNGRDTVTLEARLAHLLPAFGHRPMARIIMADVERYKDERRQDVDLGGGRIKPGATNGTINRELEVLARAFTLGKHLELLTATLPVRRARLAEAKPRAGFFEPDQFDAVCRRLPADLQVAVALAYTLGWRMQSEVLALERRHVDLEAGTIRLDPGMAKNDDARVVYLTADLIEGVRAQLARVESLQRATGAVVPYLFPHLGGRHRGDRILDFVKRWRAACRDAGCPGMLRHDFRRTAVRNMVNAGVPERVAMGVTGHKTRSVFDRYHIVSPADLQEAARKMTATLRVTLRDAGREAASAGTPGHSRSLPKVAGTHAEVGG